MDEAQDFPISFYRICRQITSNNRVIWAYDDFQNILKTKIQDEKETFGKDEKGRYYIDFSRKNEELQDLVLHVCYRNPKKILLSAFALGLGIYNKDPKTNKIKIIQRLENNEHWESLGFEVEKGNSKEGEEMIIGRSDENSPILKNKLLEEWGDVIRLRTFKNLTEECAAVTKMILEDLEKELNPEDITIIALDDRNAKTYFEHISAVLLKQGGIKTFSLLNAPNDNTIYKMPKHITLSTIYRAKGNEAGSVYVVGIDAVFDDKDNITERNKLFTAMTRSLAWVTLTGISPYADVCKEELDILKSNSFKLIFTQPSEQDVVTIRQNIDKKQSMLNKMERIADELARESDLTKEEIIEALKGKTRLKK